MASETNFIDSQVQNDSKKFDDDAKLAYEGIQLMLNNHAKESYELFNKHKYFETIFQSS